MEFFHAVKALACHIVVVCMRANPKPKHSILYFLAQGPVMKADADGPVPTHFFQMQRRVSRIGFQTRERFVGKFLDVDRQ